MKSLKIHWIIGVSLIVLQVILYFLIIGIFLKILQDYPNLQQQQPLTPEQLQPYVEKMMPYILLMSLVGIVMLVNAIMHIVSYSKGNFGTDSKVSSALFQFFFGLNLIGLIIVLVIKPKQLEPANTDL